MYDDNAQIFLSSQIHKLTGVLEIGKPFYLRAPQLRHVHTWLFPQCLSAYFLNNAPASECVAEVRTPVGATDDVCRYALIRLSPALAEGQKCTNVRIPTEPRLRRKTCTVQVFLGSSLMAQGYGVTRGSAQIGNTL